MQVADSGPSGPGPVRVLGPSLSFELTWAVHGARAEHLLANHAPLARLYGDDPGLRQRVRTFWEDGPDCFAEFDVLAYFAGAFELTEFAPLEEALRGAVGAVPADLPLRSETPEVRTAIYRRLESLDRSPRLRDSYVGILGELAAGLEPWWHGEGIATVERVAADSRRMLERGGDWRQLVGSGCELVTAHLPEIVDGHQAGTPIALAPCALFGKGLYLDLPDCILVGFAAGRGDAAARVRTEQVAQRLRALSDPTRLAILDFLAAGPTSVGEIARAFSLAQPTVSGHVKHLREAGLVTARRQGSKVEISIDRGATGRLADELSTLLTS